VKSFQVSLSQAFALLGLLLLDPGCHREDPQSFWGANAGMMRQRIGDIDQLRFEGKATNIAKALDILGQRDSRALTMYGFKETYRFNPEWSNYTNETASNEVAVVEVVLLKHNGKPCYLGVTYDLKPVELNELPKWANK
jgi:hypothetical protein